VEILDSFLLQHARWSAEELNVPSHPDQRIAASKRRQQDPGYRRTEKAAREWEVPGRPPGPGRRPLLPRRPIYPHLRVKEDFRV
jgi:hypothetical protein